MGRSHKEIENDSREGGMVCLCEEKLWQKTHGICMKKSGRIKDDRSVIRTFTGRETMMKWIQWCSLESGENKLVDPGNLMGFSR